MAESSKRDTRNTTTPNGQRERYGDNSRTLPAKLIVIAIVGILVITGAHIFVQTSRVSAPGVSATRVGQDRTSGKEDEQFIFTLDVTREKPELDNCYTIYTPNYDPAEVGRCDVFVPDDGSETARMDVPTAARELATTGDIYGCSTGIPELLAPAK